MPDSINSEWYFARGVVQNGPYDSATMRSMVASGQVIDSDLVWREGMPAWAPLAQVAELNSTAWPAAASPQQVAPSPAYAVSTSTAANYAAHGMQPANAPQGYAVTQITPNYQTPGQSYNGMAIGGFVCALIPMAPLPLVGLILSIVALRGMKRTGNIEGKGLATAGAIIGGILTGLACLVWGFIISAFIAAGAAGAAGH